MANLERLIEEYKKIEVEQKDRLQQIFNLAINDTNTKPVIVVYQNKHDKNLFDYGGRAITRKQLNKIGKNKMVVIVEYVDGTVKYETG
jgi:hypothetical protein